MPESHSGRRSTRRWLRRVGLPALGAALALVAAAPMASATPDGPDLTVPEPAMAQALHCSGPSGPQRGREPVLLIHGITQTGSEAWGWNYVPALAAAGVPVCTVDLPDRGRDDIQVSSEYVVYAIRDMAKRYKSRVDVLGFSQGPLEPRWAVKYWPDVRDSVDDLVSLAGTNHGMLQANLQCQATACLPALQQMKIGSNFLQTLNADDETPGDISYSSIYSLTDDVVYPQAPVSVSRQGGGATNVLIQDVCLGHVADHVQQTYDPVVYALVMDAFTHPGPVDPRRIDRSVCGALTMPGVTVDVAAQHLAAAYANGLPMLTGIGHQTTSTEPPLRSYATD